MLVLSALVIGLLLGLALERSGLCMNTAFRSILFEKDRSVLRSYLLALGISILALSVLEDFRLVFPMRSPFSLPALTLGGFLFGLGMVFAGGCVSGTFYRSGRGMIGSIVALIGFAFSASLFSSGPLGFIKDSLQSYSWTLQGEEPALFHLLPFLNYQWAKWTTVIILLIPLTLFLWKAPKEEFVIGWSWKWSGLLLGLIASLAWVISALFQRDYGLSFTQPTVSLTRYLISNDGGGINWASFSIIGVLAGAFLSALLKKDFQWRLPSADRLIKQFAGGFVMGIGAVIAGGCNIGHGLSGISVLSLASITATGFTILGCWVATAWIIRSERKRAETA